MRFATNVDSVTMVMTYADHSCETDEQEWMRLKAGLLVTSQPKRLGLPLWDHHPNGAKEVLVSTQRTRTYLMVTNGYGAPGKVFTCGVTFTQPFEDDKDYEVSYRWYPTTCTVSVSELLSADGAPTRRQVASFNNRLSTANATCLARFKSLNM